MWQALAFSVGTAISVRSLGKLAHAAAGSGTPSATSIASALRRGRQPNAAHLLPALVNCIQGRWPVESRLAWRVRTILSRRSSLSDHSIGSSRVRKRPFGIVRAA